MSSAFHFVAMGCNFQSLSILAALLILSILQEDVNGVGVNYGLLGNDLPPPSRTIEVLKSRAVTKIRIFTPDHGVLDALRGSDIEVFIGTSNEDLPALANDPSFASNWVRTHVAPYADSVIISGVVAGNDAAVGPYAGRIMGAMQNLDNALSAAGIYVPVTTAVSYGVMGASYPPSRGSFKVAVMADVARFLSSKGYPLLANIFPYFAYVNDPGHIQSSYALLKNDGSVLVPDGTLLYTNLLDAMVDAVYSALERVGVGNVRVIVSETGWPSAAGPYADIPNAQEYNNNLARLVRSGTGTPKRPEMTREAYVLAMYNENLNPPGIENHWGLYYPNLQEVYPVNLY